MASKKRIEVSPPRKIITEEPGYLLGYSTLVGLEYTTIRSPVKIIIKNSEGTEYAVECNNFYDDTPDNRTKLVRICKLKQQIEELIKLKSEIKDETVHTNTTAMLADLITSKMVSN
jgi:hypothetical protein